MNDLVNINDLTMKGVLDNPNSFSNETVQETKNQIQLFLLAKAKRELERVIKLTESLDKLQDKYMDEVDIYLKDHANDASLIRVLPKYIDVITQCLARSESILSQVMANPKLFENLHINFNTQVNDNSIVNKNYSVLSNQESREKVRDVINQVLNNIEEFENNS